MSKNNQDEEEYLAHVTYNDEENAHAEPGRVFELDVHIKPRGDVTHALALYAEEDGNEASSNDSSPGFLEKNLSDFFDI